MQVVSKFCPESILVVNCWSIVGQKKKMGVKKESVIKERGLERERRENEKEIFSIS